MAAPVVRVVTRMASIRTGFGAASSRTAASNGAAPIAVAKSSPVPAGRTARAASVPIRPLAAHETVPSPPITATIAGTLARDAPAGGLHVGGRFRDQDLMFDPELPKGRVRLADELARLAPPRGGVGHHHDGSADLHATSG